MNQLELGLLGRLDAPRKVPIDELRKVRTYREACIACWENRRVRNMTNSRLAEWTGMRPSHISDYLCPDPFDKKGRERRDMPGKHVPAFERVAGNRFVTQWLEMQSELPVLEPLIADRKSA